MSDSEADPKQVLQVRLESFLRALEKATDKQKEQFVSVSTGKQYDQLRNQAGSLYPSIANSLPPVGAISFSESSYCETYLDLELNIQQLLGLIGIAAD